MMKYPITLFLSILILTGSVIESKGVHLVDPAVIPVIDVNVWQSTESDDRQTGDSNDQQSVDASAMDTLTKAYSEKWVAAAEEPKGGLTGFLASNDLIFVVLTVSLIIWFVLLWYLIRLDLRISRIEKSRAS